MNILAIGDVVGSVGCRFLRSRLPSLKKVKGVDLVVCNGENSADGNGITPASAEYLFQSGVDVITTGNHAFRRREMYAVFDSCETVLRPANYPGDDAPGRGFLVYDMGRVQVGIVNLMGVVYLDPLDNPFDTADRISPPACRRSPSSISTRRPPAKRRASPITSTAASPPCSARTPTCRRRTSRCSRRAPATFPTSA